MNTNNTFYKYKSNLSYLPIVDTDWTLYKRDYLTFLMALRAAAIDIETKFEPKNCRVKIVPDSKRLCYANMQLTNSSLSRWRARLKEPIIWQVDTSIAMMPIATFDRAVDFLLSRFNRQTAGSYFKLFAAYFYYGEVFEEGWNGGIERLSVILGTEQGDVSRMSNWMLENGMLVRNGTYVFTGKASHCYQWKISPQYLLPEKVNDLFDKE